MLRSYMMLSHRDIVLRTVFRANKISLRPERVISLSQSENITLCTAKNITYLSCLLLKGFGYHPKAAFVLTNAMLVLSNKHIKNLDEFHRGFNHPYEK